MRSKIIEATVSSTASSCIYVRGVCLAKAVRTYPLVKAGKTTNPMDNRIFRSPEAKKSLAGLLASLVNWLAS